MPISDQEADRRWEDMRAAMILSMHKLFIEDENFKDRYFKEYNRLLKEFRQRDADNFLKRYGFDIPDENFPPQV